MNDFSMEYDNTLTMVLSELNSALRAIDRGQAERFKDAVLNAEKVFFVGVGRVLLSLKAVCKRFAHIGIDAHWVGEVTEPAITKNDLLVVGSGSGSSLFPLAIAQKAREAADCTIVHIGSNPNSQMRGLCDFMVRIPVRTKFYLDDEIDSAQPMTSLFEQALLLFGDIIAKMIIDEKGLELKDLWKYHANLE